MTINNTISSKLYSPQTLSRTWVKQYLVHEGETVAGAFNPDLNSTIQLGEVSRLSKLIKQIHNERNRVLVLDCYLVKCPVVYTHPQGPVLLPLK
ncbi:hypothetical protein Tco_1075019 [Tanacetum coccineum]